ncbi:Uncharacterised protein [Mycobacteroides abscessus subsp. abscessus]|nr:Uncharacterised protein [Mycobacteroides abscessus subsp. abscessus]
MLVRGRPSRSKVSTATSSASVESRPPDTPMTILSMPVARRRAARP